jgi:hypothetical protein
MQVPKMEIAEFADAAMAAETGPGEHRTNLAVEVDRGRGVDAKARPEEHGCDARRRRENRKGNDPCRSSASHARVHIASKHDRTVQTRHAERKHEAYVTGKRSRIRSQR